MHRLCIRDPYSTRSKGDFANDEANRKEKFCQSYRINFVQKLHQTSFVFRGCGYLTWRSIRFSVYQCNEFVMNFKAFAWDDKKFSKHARIYWNTLIFLRRWFKKMDFYECLKILKLIRNYFFYRRYSYIYLWNILKDWF